LEAVFIEGHTDSDPFAQGSLRDNWVLSAERAINTYKEIAAARPGLESLRNTADQHLLGVSGYEARRPTDRSEGQSSDDKKAADRRIDLRFIMKSLTPEVLQQIEQNLGKR
jgi:flagellar motor protein MotB